MQQKQEKRRKRKGPPQKNPKIEKPKDIGHFLLQKLSNYLKILISAHARVKNVTKRHASGKKAKLSWCKCIFDQIEGNLTEIKPKNYQNVQETPFFSQKAPGFNGLNTSFNLQKSRVQESNVMLSLIVQLLLCKFNFNWLLDSFDWVWLEFRLTGYNWLSEYVCYTVGARSQGESPSSQSNLCLVTKWDKIT